MISTEQMQGLTARDVNGIGKPCVGAMYTSLIGDAHKLLPGAVCAVCGRPATNAHHATPKGLGGGRQLLTIDGLKLRPSLIALCGSGTTGCHGLVHQHKIVFEWRWSQGYTDDDFINGDVPLSEVADYGMWLAHTTSGCFDLLGKSKNDYLFNHLKNALESKRFTKTERLVAEAHYINAISWSELPEILGLAKSTVYYCREKITAKLYD